MRVVRREFPAAHHPRRKAGTLHAHLVESGSFLELALDVVVLDGRVHAATAAGARRSQALGAPPFPIRMPIRPPGLRLLKSVPLPYVQRSVRAPQRPHDVKLSLTSMIDCLVVLVVFLLMAFAASSECPAPGVERPRAHSVQDMLDLPVVSVRGGEVLLDGAFAGTTHALEESNRVERIDALFDGLRTKRSLYGQLHPGREYPGGVLLDIDAHEPAVVVKSVVSTAALAGSPRVGFVVDRL